MKHSVCPQCRADIDDDLVASTGSTECPFCGADLSKLFPAPDIEQEQFGPRSATPTVGNVGSEPTGKDKIQIIEETNERLLIHIPPGGVQSRAIGCFALFWNGFMVVVTIPMLLGDGLGNDAPLLFVIPFIGLFWIIGLGMLYWWIRLRFMRFFLLLEPDRLVIQRILFGRKSAKETVLSKSSQARLTVAYKQNDTPVYKVSIDGTSRTESFGSALSRENKDRLVEIINGFLGAAADEQSSAVDTLTNCPTCGEPLDRIIIKLPGGERSCPHCAASLVTEDSRFSAATDSLTPPADSKIELVDSSDSQLVIHIPPGGESSKGLGFFALVWNGFMCVFTPPWFLAGPKPGMGEMFFLIPFLTLFWLIGLGVLYGWVRMRFSRTFVLLELERLAVQRLLFGHKSTKNTTLDLDSRAKLVESYRQNEIPVYRVEVNGTNRKAKFGTNLSMGEKDWLVGAINLFLNVAPERTFDAANIPRACPACGISLNNVILDASAGEYLCSDCEASLAQGPTRVAAARKVAEEVLELHPASLPAESEITLLASQPDHMRFHLPLIPAGRVRSFFKFLLLPISALVLLLVAWSSTDEIAGAGNLFDWFAFIGLFFKGSACLIPLLVILFVLCARITVDLTPERFRVRWHLGPLGITRQSATEKITQVAVTNLLYEKRLQERPGIEIPTDPVEFKGCLVAIGDTNVPLTTFHETETARQVAGLFKYHLRKMGFEPVDA